ncbi:hypothetical protein F5Y05DRAFT_406402 [Hypoxylon sp. FL0543]|nr:hypothetical protein F5Y05DRAFT_406402 [Hypoxylon sp. FL0543]
MSLDLYRSSMVTCRYAIPASLAPVGQDQGSESHEILQQKIESAMAKVVLDHPFLRVGLLGEDKRKPYFVELEAVDFRRHVEWRSFGRDADYETELLKLIAARLDVKVESPVDAPSWRVLVLRVEGSAFLEVMFEWGHAHLDGTSAKMFHEDLLRNLNSQVVVGEFQDRVLTIPPSKRRDLLPPLHALVKFPVSTGYALATLWGELAPSGLSTDSKAELRATWAPMKVKPYATQCRHFSIDNATLQRILAACRKHNTTVTGLLQALSHVILSVRLSPEEAKGFLGSTIVNLRPLMSAPEVVKKKALKSGEMDPKKTMANFMTQMAHEWDAEWVSKVRAAKVSASASHDGPSNEGKRESTTAKEMAVLEPLVWSAAESARAAIQKRLDDGTKNDPMGLMKFIPDYRALFKDWIKKPRGHSVVVTNLGVIDGNPSDPASDDVAARTDAEEQGEKWTIERAIFSISAEAHGAALCLCPIAVKGKELYVSCDWHDCALDVALAEGFVADLEAWLRYIGRSTT